MPNALKTVQKFFPKVKRVVDATHPLKIEVTADDALSKGTKKHDSCAMAVACKRKFKLSGVIISRSMAYLVKGDSARRFMLPPSVTREIVSFDRGSGFSPGTYALSAVRKSSKLLGRRQGTRPKRKPTVRNGPKRFSHLTTEMRAVLGGAK